MSVAEQIKKWRLAAGLTQQQLADAIGVTRSAINQWEHDTPKLRDAHIIGLSRTLKRPASTFQRFGGGTVTAADKGRHPVLLLGWEDVKHVSAEGKVLTNAIKKLAYIDVGKDISKRAFALVVQDDSMEPVFCAGDEIVIDPDTEPSGTEADRDYVLVRLKDGEELFRRYESRRAGAYDLVAENPDWDTVSVNVRHPAQILGVLVEHRKKRRKR
jgi:DNA-binding XRE family transcriptional regulator